MFLLDTNVVSELRKLGDGRADPAVASWAKTQVFSDVFISAITLMELEIGVLRIERRDAAQGARLRDWLDARIKPEFADRTLAVDQQVAIRCAHLHVPDPRSDRDALIAATAAVHNLTVVTRNTADFDGAGVALVDPWLHPGGGSGG